MTGPISLPDLAQQINATLDRAAAGRLMLQVEARLLLAGTSSWRGWVAANLDRGERACQKCVRAAREDASDRSHKRTDCPADLVLAEQGPLPPTDVVVFMTDPSLADEPDVPQAVDLPLTAPALGVVEDIADTFANDLTTDIAEFDVAYTEVDVVDDSELVDEPVPSAADAATAPEPIPAPPIPHAAQAVATAYLALPPGRWRHECLAWVEAGCPGDWSYFITDLQARAATLELRHEMAFYTDDQTRQAFARWARSLELGSARP
jgi:hypothetical protein